MSGEVLQGVGANEVIRTVVISSHVYAQGFFVRELPNGLVEVRDGSRTYIGRPVENAS